MKRHKMFLKIMLLTIVMCVTSAKDLPKTMKAVVWYKFPVSNPNSFLDMEVDLPGVRETDILVEVKATAVHPADVKERAAIQAVETWPRILGWDGSGVVVDKGPNVTNFDIGDEVFFTSDNQRNGSYAEYISVEEIEAGLKPKNLTFEESAALPMTSLTAYEALYDRMGLSEKDEGKCILILGSSAGVGSIAAQLAKNLGLIVIGTATRPETEGYSRQNGADFVINHTLEMIAQLTALGFADGVDFILVNRDPTDYWDDLVDVIKPQGKICLIENSRDPVNLKVLEDKSITLTFENRFTRTKYNTEDKFRSYDILKEISRLLDEGKLKTIVAKVLSPINSDNIREGHRIMEEQHMTGKLVIKGF